MSRRTRMRTRMGKKSRGKLRRRRRTRRPRRISKRFIMRGGDKTTNIKFLNITNNTVFLIGGLDKRGDDGQPIPGTKPIEKRAKVEPQKYLTVQNPEVNNLTELTINDNGGNEIFKFKLNTGENCLVIISDTSDTSDDLIELKRKIPELGVTGVLVPLHSDDKYKIHKALAGPENGGSSQGKMDYNINMKSTKLNDVGFSSQI